MKEYINWLKKNNYSKNTIRTYDSVLSQYTYLLRDIRLVKKAILSHQKSPNTCILHYNIVISYMKWNNDKRVKDLQTMKLPKVPIVYRDVFTKRYLYSRTDIKDTDSKEIVKKKMTIRFLYETGIRASEIYSIKSITPKYLVITGKGNKERAVLYNKVTFELCYPFVFTTKTLRVWTKEVLGDKYTPHSIRRSFATHLLSNGANPKMVQMQMGHVKIETTFSYLNLSIKDNAKIYAKYF